MIEIVPGFLNLNERNIVLGLIALAVGFVIACMAHYWAMRR